ncbi:hypothetical protein C6P40_004505, partial [Pichia californica]
MDKQESSNHNDDTESVDSSPDVLKFNPLDDPENQENAGNLSRAVTHILSTDQGIERIATLAR